MLPSVSLRGKPEFKILLLSIMLLGLGSLLCYSKANDFYYNYNLLPAQFVIELVFFVCCSLSVRFRLSRNDTLVFFSLAFYLVMTLSFLVVRKNGVQYILDYLLIYKSWIYVMALTLVGRNILSLENYQVITKLLIILFFTKYILAKILFGIERPGLFVENNFELLLLLLLYVTLAYHRIQLPFVFKVLFYLVFVLSGSRSGMGALVFSMLCLSSRGVPIKRLFNYAFSLVAITGAVVIFVDRMSGTEGLVAIDRFKFLMVFVEEFRGFGFVEKLLGAPVITALQSDSCTQLSFYSRLFSRADPNACYSVVLHSFVLRALFDHGILGLLAACYVPFYLLVRSGYSKGFCLILIAIVFINGLSVSSFNSAFFALAFFLIIGASVGIRQSAFKVSAPVYTGEHLSYG